MLADCSVVVGCAGPFTLHGEGLVAAAAETGTHYLDTTGEQPFIRMVFEKYGERAAETGAALVSGMGFDYLPGDMLAALVAEGMGPLEEIVVAYHVDGFAPTHGTALSALEIMRGGDVVWADGDWRAAPRSADGGRWRFPEPIGEQRMLRYPAGEQITVPRHVETKRVRTLLSGMVVPPRLMPVAVAASPLLGLAMRTPLRSARRRGDPASARGAKRRGPQEVALHDQLRGARRLWRPARNAARQRCLRTDRREPRPRRNALRRSGLRPPRRTCAGTGIRPGELPVQPGPKLGPLVSRGGLPPCA